MLTLAILLALPMGLVVGLLGGGGSILTLPILVYALGLGTREAIATSLLVVGLASAVSMVQHARAGDVRFRLGLIFGLLAMLGAYLGGTLAAYVPGQILILMFISLMLITAAAMLRSKPGHQQVQRAARQPISLGKIALEGLFIGGITGMVGAGGGFLVVPALVLFARLDMRAAIGTSLFIITMNAFAGLAGHLSHTAIDIKLALAIAIPAIVASFLGACLSHRSDPQRLRTWFAYLVLTMAVFMLYRSFA